MKIFSKAQFLKSMRQLVFTSIPILASVTAIATPLDLSDRPLFVAITVQPNVVLTLDDSGSMARASVPDSINTEQSQKRFKSSSYNALYYDPDVTYTPPPRFNGTTCPNSIAPDTCYPNSTFTSAWINGFDSTRGTVNLSNNYQATQNYNPSSTSQTFADATAEAAYYYTFKASNTNCDGSATDEDCYTKFTVTGATQQQNFANWYSYYRTRNLALVTSAMRSLSDLGDNVRVAWQALNSCNSFGTDCDGWGLPASDLDNRIKRLGATRTVVTGSNSETVGPITTGTSITTHTYICRAFFNSRENESRTDRIELDTCRQTSPASVDPKMPPTSGLGTPGYSSTTTGSPVTTTSGLVTTVTTTTTAISSSDVTTSGATPSSHNKSYTVSSVSSNGSEVRFSVPSQITSDSADPVSNVTLTWNETTTTTETKVITTQTTGEVTHKEDLYTWLSRFPAFGGTPLIRAANNSGKYFQGTITSQHPFAEDPNVLDSEGTLYSCRRNVSLVMTDGGWCGTSTSDLYKFDTTTAIGDANSEKVTVASGPDGSTFEWTPGAPYRDGQGNNMADIAFHYWATDLSSELENDIEAVIRDQDGSADEIWKNPKNDPATWQHLNTYTVGLGLATTMVSPYPVWGGSTHAGDYSKLFEGTSCPTTTTATSSASKFCWPTTAELDNSDSSCVVGQITSNEQRNRTYDLWHAAISSRGKFFGSDSPEDLVSAFDSIISEVTEDSGASASAAANSSSIQTGTVLFQAQFNSSTWSGHLYSYPVTSSGVDTNNPNWDAADLIPSTRKLYTWNGTGGSDFNLWADLTTEQKNALKTSSSGVVGSDTIGQERHNWLRGIQAEEESSGGDYRDRKDTVLGDIVDSDPVFVYSDDFGYSNLPSTPDAREAERSTYNAFVTAKKDRIPMVFVGANDGMLHGFRGDNGNVKSGEELFAYVPNAVFSNLSALTDPDYTHQFYVDGSPIVGDAYLSGNWKTVLVGGLRNGGKAIYALDITDPATFSTGNVMWEYSGASTDTGSTGTTDKDGMGYTYSEPQIARLNNDQWVVIFGNGYNSTSEKAFLYIVDLRTGTLIKKIPVPSSIDTTSANGLSTPLLYDNNNDKIIDAVYAGDLHGNLWEFDLSGSSSGWVLGNGGSPLFTARNGAKVQPITSPPTLSAHTDGGVMIYFGTGSYLTSADVSNKDIQTYYGVWDKPTMSSTVTVSELQEQTITRQEKVTIEQSGGNQRPAEIRTVSSNSVDYNVKRGWYMNLVPPSPASPEGERVISPSVVLDDRVVFLTAIPSSDPCVTGGRSFLMELDLISGSATGTSAYDLNNDNQFNDSDKFEGEVVVGLGSGSGMGDKPVFLKSEDGKSIVKEISKTDAIIWEEKNRPSGDEDEEEEGGVVKRQFWQQLQ